MVDNLSGKIHLIVYADPSHPQGYETARAKLESLREKLRQSVAIPLSLGSRRTVPQHLTGEENIQKTMCAACANTSSTATACKSFPRKA